MNKARIYVSVLVNFLLLESFSFASTQITIVPENFPQIFPHAVGTPTLHMNIEGESFDKSYLLKRNEVISFSLQNPLKEAHIEYGVPFKHRVVYCKEDRNKTKNTIISIRYSENADFICNLKNE